MKFTIGVPVYNVEDNVEACLKSLSALQGDDLEIIVVDDGSKDGSGAICDRVAAGDDRIKVIHKENGGVSSARNAVIENAAGEWISFVDGDDMLAPSALETMRKYADESFDIITFDMQFFVFDNAISKYTNQNEPIELTTPEEVEQLALSTMYSAADGRDFKVKTLRSCCAKLFKKEYLMANELRFSTDLPYAQDVYFNLCCLAVAKRVRIICTEFYYYRQNPKSIVHRFNPKMYSNINILSDKLEGYAKSYPDSKAMTDRFCLRTSAHLGGVLKLYICNPYNPASMEEKRREFDDVCGRDWCRHAFEIADPSRLTQNDRQAYDVYIKRDFDSICRYYAKKERREKLKIFVNRLGLNKIIKPLIAKMKRG